MSDDIDPFADSTSSPNLSFKNSPVGTVKTLKITETAKLLQCRDFSTQLPLYWDPVKTGAKTTTPNDKPIMAAVVKGVDDSGDSFSVWAQKPSSLYTALKDAQDAVSAGYRLKVGDELAIKFESEKQPENRGYSPQKIYKAKVTQAPEPVASDPFAEPPF